MHKAVIYLSCLIAIITVISCTNFKSNKNNEHELTLFNNFRDTCIYFIEHNKDTISIIRELEIIENTMSDTILLGNSCVRPFQTGYIFMGQVSTNRDAALYNSPDAIKHMRDNNTKNYGTNILCLYHRKINEVSKSDGYIKIKYKKFIKQIEGK